MAASTLRVIVITHMYPRTAGDFDGIFVHEQVKALRARGVDARVLVGDPVGYRMSRSKETARMRLFPRTSRRGLRWGEVEGVPALHFLYAAPFPPQWSEHGAPAYRREVKHIAGAVRREFRFDVVHAHTALLDGTAGAWLGRRFDVPYVLTEHTGPFSTLTADAQMRAHTQRAINAADGVVTVSESLRRTMFEAVEVSHPERWQVIPNGIDPEVFKVAPPRSRDDGEVRALWIGGYHEVKQPFMLVDAFTRAAAEIPGLTLTLVGGGPLERQVREAAASLEARGRIRMRPVASRAQVAEYLREHDFLVVSSLTETFGIIVLEALSSGRPVLTTRCGGPEEIVSGPEYGEVVDNDAASLARGFGNLTRRLENFDPGRLHAHVADRFRFARVACRLEGLFRETIAAKERRHAH